MWQHKLIIIVHLETCVSGSGSYESVIVMEKERSFTHKCYCSIYVYSNQTDNFSDQWYTNLPPHFEMDV